MSFKKILLLIFISGKMFSQSYTFSPSNTYIMYLDTMVTDYTERAIEVVNTGSTALNLTWTQSLVDTTDMSLDFCNSGICFTGLPQSGAMPTIQPGGKGWIKYHVYTYKTKGTNTVRYVLKNGNLQTDTLTHVFIIGGLTGIKKINAINTEISIYPNPVIDYLIINSKIDQATIEVYNLNGTRVINKDLPNGLNKIDAKELPDGVYFYNVKNKKNEFSSGKFIISH